MTLKIIQINLQHRKGATATLVETMRRIKANIALIQEPWVCHNAPSLGLAGKIHTPTNDGEMRTCILTRKGLEATLILHLSDRDNTVVAFECKNPNTSPSSSNNDSHENYRWLAIATYLSWIATESPPGDKRREILKSCIEKNIKAVIGADINARHARWDSTDTNTRGNRMVEFLDEFGLIYHNRGNTPTFVTRTREEVLDATYSTQEMYYRIRKWRVLSKDSLSDHRYISFETEEPTTRTPISRRNLRKTRWTEFLEEIVTKINNLPSRYSSNSIELSNAAEALTTTIAEAWENSTEEKECKIKIDIPWWSEEIADQQKLIKNRTKIARRNKHDPSK
ncbi:uncharacterized protein LOC128894829 [Hylaeus anthracinus]|uniref:uncharacterized protein LOC128894829 n=1 Tax=Hylaeus anthracinus TaxID=313031 RepID=UPI0023B9A2D3|nr:uncharacterized protein LOC128894829 [Hylaeus anthracinus]